MTKPARKPTPEASPQVVTWIKLDWAGKVRRFHMPAQDPFAANMAGRGPMPLRPILGRLISSAWSATDVRVAICEALKNGGDFKPVRDGVFGQHYPDLDALVERQLAAAPLADAAVVAILVLRAAIYGAPQDLAEKGLPPGEFLAALTARNQMEEIAHG